MAKIKTNNTLVTLGTGPLGQAVLATWKHTGMYARRKYKDSKRSVKQIAWREKYTTADRVWINATKEEREAWRPRRWRPAWSNYAEYMSYNLRRVRDGLPPTLTPPW